MMPYLGTDSAMENQLGIWQARIRSAADESEVILAVQTCVSSLGSAVIGTLPTPCEAHQVRDRETVAAYTLQLVRDELLFRGPQEIREVLRGMSIVFNEAGMRLSQLSRDRHSPGAAS